MNITYDPIKNNTNIQQRGLSFDRATDFDYEAALVTHDSRKHYGEDRYIALGLLDGRVHVLVFTPTADGIRVISFRKANKREVRTYENAR